MGTNAVLFLHFVEERDAEKSTFLSSLHMSYCFASCHAAYQELYRRVHIVFQRSTEFCTTFAENNSLSSLMVTNEHIFSIIVLTSWSLLRQCLEKFSTPAGVEGKMSNKNVVGFITLFSCLSLLSVIWDYQMLDYSIFRGCCEEKASREKGYMKINYHQ